MLNKKKNGKQRQKANYGECTGNILSENSKFVVNEAYKMARTNIMFSFPDDDGCKVIACTSAMQGEGKTTTCINLAISFAQTGARVILIDADLRKPRVDRYLNIENSLGLSELCGGLEHDIDKVVQYVEDKNLYCITSGRIPPNPAELIGSENMDKLLETLRESYDYVFVDVPPVNIVTDATILAKKCSGTMLVVRENDTTHDTFSAAIDSLKFFDVKIIGIIVNYSVGTTGGKYKYRHAYRKTPYGSYAGYGYGYGKDEYGYGYGYDKKESKRRGATAEDKSKNDTPERKNAKKQPDEEHADESRVEINDAVTEQSFEIKM